MIVNIPKADEDDDVFLAALNGLIARVVDEYGPQIVHIVRVDNWFDHKWLRFSGKGRVAFPYGEPYVSTALDEFRQEKLTFPPFSPNRVVDELAFERVSSKGYRRRAGSRVIHRPQRGHSSANLQRRVADFSSSGLFIWFSSKSASSRRASLMAYGASNGATSAWFASFSDREGWCLDRVKGIDRAELLSWFPIET